MSRPRSHSNPNPRRPYPPYPYLPLSSPRHIRIIRILHFDPALSQVYISIDEHDLSYFRKRFTALSYTWGSALEHYEEAICTAQLSPDATRLRKTPKDVQLVILPKEAFETFQRRDDLANQDGAMLDMYTTPVSTLKVTGNLADFFRSYADGWPHKQHTMGYRAGLKSDQICNLWIDAICIDQGNEKEISAQIPLMGEVYSSAGRVLAWLGADEARLDVFRWLHAAVYPLIQLAIDRYGEKALMHFRTSNFTEDDFWESTFQLKPPTQLGMQSWGAVWVNYYAFFRARRYFQRVWIVQEVVMAENLHLHCGNGVQLRGKDLEGFVHLLGQLGWVDTLEAMAGAVLEKDGLTYTSRDFGFADILEVQRHHTQRIFEVGGWPRHWYSAVSAVRRRGCFKPQDKVFATVGILQQALPSHIPFPFPIDASLSAEVVFTHAAAVLLRHWPELSLFGFIERPSRRLFTDLPSWVPDLTTAEFAWTLGPFDSQFSAGIPPIPIREVDIATGTLKVRGIMLDTIKKKYEYSPPMNIRLAEVVLQVLSDLPVDYPHTSPMGDSPGQFRESALIHTMTGHEYTNPHRGRPEETARLSLSFRDYLLVGLGQLFSGAAVQDEDTSYDPNLVADLQRRKELAIKLLRGLNPKRLIPREEEILAYADSATKARNGEGEWPVVVRSPQEFNDQIRRVMVHRSLFTTADGWLGICLDETTEEGDEVWVLEGGAVPYVLKKKPDGTRRFCGESYVHGVMSGELVNGEEGEVEKKWQDVVLV
ncbi:heterokaryon incompatibility protein-domain-containing protein [Podospora australis]|uniref:Heterokaryon incompatibility protein-domain-containing protein n=1 Tax=Podospora australis TaxID=1536484 RepID=A0AAN7ABH4_9PEZI|nr:heterokaryon incompatibility protein-domain-containing protein [Podospora australis]